MTNDISTAQYLGDISETNQAEFPEAIQEVFRHLELNPELQFFIPKNEEAQWQFDRNTARQLLQNQPNVSLKDALTEILSNLPHYRSDAYVRTFVQWFVEEYETTFTKKPVRI